MKTVTRTPLAALAVASLALAAGCAEISYPRPATVVVPPDQARVAFDAPAFANTSPVRVRYTDLWQAEEYARFQGEGAQAEIVYSRVVAVDRVSLDYRLVINDAVETWTYNKGRPKMWGTAEIVRTPLSLIWYKPYTLTDRNQSCFGFTTEGNAIPYDPMLGQYFAVFGYYCAKPGETLSQGQMEQLVNNVGIIGVSKPRWKAETESAKAAAPVARVSGDPVQIARAGADAGNPKFPFMFARWYAPTEGNDRR